MGEKELGIAQRGMVVLKLKSKIPMVRGQRRWSRPTGIVHPNQKVVKVVFFLTMANVTAQSIGICSQSQCVSTRLLARLQIIATLKSGTKFQMVVSLHPLQEVSRAM